MNLYEILRVAWRSISNNKLRTLLTMLGVIIGVAAVIIMVSVSAGTEAAIADQINSLGPNLIFINSSIMRMMPGAGGSSQGGLVYDDVAAIRDEINKVAGVSVEQNASETVRSDSATIENVSMLGTTPDFPSVRDLEVGMGRFFTDEELERKAKVVVLGADLADELFGETSPVGQKLTVGTTKMTVIGVLAQSGLMAGVDYNSQMFTPITVIFQWFNNQGIGRMFGDRVRTIYVQAESPEEIDDVIQQVTLLLMRRHDVSLDALDFTIMTQEDIIETQESTTESFRTLLGWVAGVSLIVGGIGIMNIMLVSVTERTREIGIRQSVGATPSDIRWQFLTEALILSMIGGLIGIVGGVSGANVFGQLSGMATVVSIESVVMAFGSAAIVGIFFGFIPANKAAQLDPIDALRHE